MHTTHTQSSNVRVTECLHGHHTQPEFESEGDGVPTWTPHTTRVRILVRPNENDELSTLKLMIPGFFRSLTHSDHLFLPETHPENPCN